MLAAHYSRGLTADLAAFPGPVRGPASDSLAQALEIAKHVGPQGAQLTELAQTAFLEAMKSSLLVMAVIITVAAVVIGLWSPGRNGEQLAPVQRLTANRTTRSPGRHRA